MRPTKGVITDEEGGADVDNEVGAWAADDTGVEAGNGHATVTGIVGGLWNGR